MNYEVNGRVNKYIYISAQNIMP